MKRHEMPVIPTDNPDHFIMWLSHRGISVSRETHDPYHLFPQQDEFSGVRIGHYYDNPSDSPIWIDTYNYIWDGHHRWAAEILRWFIGDDEAEPSAPVIVIQAETYQIRELIDQYNQEWGIERKSVPPLNWEDDDGCPND